MSRKIKTLITALGVLALLSGVYYWSITWNKKKSDSASSSYTLSPSLGNLESSRIAKINANTLALEKINETWKLVSLEGEIPPERIELDQAQIQYMANYLANVRVEQIVDETPSDLSQYGLERPSYRVSVTDSAGQKAEYILGDMTPSRVSYYIMETGDPRVYSVSAYTAERMQVALDNIRQRYIFPSFELSALTQLRLESSRFKQIEVIPKPETLKPYLTGLFSTHIITSPYIIRRGADTEALNNLLMPFKELLIADFVDDAPSSLKPYGLDEPVRIFLRTEDASLDLLIGNGIGGKRYAKLASTPEVFTLDGMEGVANVKPFALIDKFALLINIDRVNRLLISGGDKNLSVDFKGEGDDRLYYINGRKIETASFKAFYQTVIGLIADAEYPGPVLNNENSGELVIEYHLNNPPGELESFTLIPYNRDFYALRQEGTTEFLISRRQVLRIYEAVDAVIYEEL
jgi:hypothetical protein